MTQHPSSPDGPSRDVVHYVPPAAEPRKSAGGHGRLIGALAATGVLGAAAFLNHARAKEAEGATPPVGRFVTVDGVRLHYTDSGAGGGPAVVLLHGNGAFLQDFEISGVTGLAAAMHRVIAFDRPGFGYSDRPRSTVWTPSAQGTLIVRALAAIGVERFVVVGHSWGAMVALAMALDHPEAVSGLVLCAGYYYPTARGDLGFALPAVPLVGDVLRYTVSPLAGLAIAPVLFKAMFSPEPVPERFSAWPTGLSLRPSQVRASAADAGLMVPAAAKLSARYGELRLPVVIIGGTGDRIAFFERHSKALHADLPGSELVTMEGAGHMVHYSDPARVVAAIERVAWLAGQAPGTLAA